MDRQLDTTSSGRAFRETGFDVMAMTPRKARYLWRDHQRYAELTDCRFAARAAFQSRRQTHCAALSRPRTFPVRSARQVRMRRALAPASTLRARPWQNTRRR